MSEARGERVATLTCPECGHQAQELIPEDQ